MKVLACLIVSCGTGGAVRVPRGLGCTQEKVNGEGGDVIHNDE